MRSWTLIRIVLGGGDGYTQPVLVAPCREPGRRMKSNRRTFLYLLPAVVFFCNGLVIESLRPAFRSGSHPYLAFVLGWMPNYLAGLGFMALGIAILALAGDLTRDARLPGLAHPFMLLVAAGSLLGLIGWEFAQQAGRLVFDVDDILATVGGVLTGYGLFVVAHRRHVLLASTR